CSRERLAGHGDSGQRQRSHTGLRGPDHHAACRRQAGAEAAEARAPPRGPGLRFRAGAADLALVGHYPDPRRAGYRTWQRTGRVPLVRGADHLLAAFVRSIAAPPGSAHGDSRSVPPSGLFPHRFEVPGPIASFFPSALTDFEIAVVEEDLLRDVTAAGTLPYMAPEQLGERLGPVDHRADLY